MDRRNHWYRKAREFLIEAFFGECWNCGSQEGLEFAHMEPTKLNGRGRGYSQRILDVINNPTKYMLVCKECHHEIDYSNGNN